MAETLEEFLVRNRDATEEQIAQRMKTATDDELGWCLRAYVTSYQRRATAAKIILGFSWNYPGGFHWMV